MYDKKRDKVKALGYILIGLLFLAPALADIDIVFDRTISSSTQISLNGTLYVVQIGSVNNSLVKLVSDTETITLDEGDCVTRNYDEFCYEEYDEDQKINAKLTDARPIIEVDRIVSSRSLDLGEVSNIQLVVENVGGTKINDFYFLEAIPNGLNIFNVSGCDVHSDNSQIIEWDEDLFPNQPKYCNYSVQATKAGIFTYEGKYTTDVLVSSLDGDAVPQVSITANKLIELDIFVSESNLDVGQPFVLSFEVENVESANGDNLSINNITVNYDGSFAFLKEYDSNFSTASSADFFRFSGIIEPQEKFDQSIELVPIIPDENLSLSIDISYRVGTDQPIMYTRIIELNQSFFPLECEYLVVDDAGNNLISFQKLNNTLPGYNRGEVFVYVTNLNPYVDIENMRFSSSGDFDFPRVPRITQLRRSDTDVLFSKPFAFDSLSEFSISSQVEIGYFVLEEFFETSCNGNLLVEEPEFLSFEKNVSFVNISPSRSIPRVELEIKNMFFAPITNIEVVEVLPSKIFSNNNTRKNMDLSPLEAESFSYDFIIPADYVTLDGETLQLESLVTYEIYGQEFTDTVSLTLNVNEVIASLEGVVLDGLIQTKVELLREEIDKEIRDNLLTINETNTSIEPIITYSPFLDYFSISLLVFLFFMALIIINIKYSILGKLNAWHERRKSEATKKREELFAKKYGAFVQKEHDIDKCLIQKKKEVKSLKNSVLKQEEKFKKISSTLHLKKLLAQKKIDKKQKELSLFESKKQQLEAQMATAHSMLMSYQNESQTLDVQKSKELSVLQEKKSAFEKLRSEIAQLESQKVSMEKSLELMKKDFKDIEEPKES